MTPQIKLLLAGLAGFAVAKFYYKRDTVVATTYGLAVISTVAILTAHKDEKS